MRPPDLANAAGTIRAWHYERVPGIGPADWDAGLTSWYIEANAGVLDPVFGGWYVGGVSLRDIPGVRAAFRKYPNAQYELSCHTIDPNAGVTAELWERRTTGATDDRVGFLLQPPDVVYQWHGTTDEGAVGVCESFVNAVVLGGLSPSRPAAGLSRTGMLFLPGPAWAFDADWEGRLAATVEHYATGHVPPAPGGDHLQ